MTEIVPSMTKFPFSHNGTKFKSHLRPIQSYLILKDTNILYPVLLNASVGLYAKHYKRVIHMTNLVIFSNNPVILGTIPVGFRANPVKF